MGRPADPEITLARIENALARVADLLIDDDAYLPVFLRLECELEEARARQSAIDRARRIIRKRDEGPSMDF